MSVSTERPRSFTLFGCFDAAEHGWLVDDTLMAHKCGLSITAHGLYALVRDVGWRAAERMVAEREAHRGS